MRSHRGQHGVKSELEFPRTQWEGVLGSGALTTPQNSRSKVTRLESQGSFNPTGKKTSKYDKFSQNGSLILTHPGTTGGRTDLTQMTARPGKGRGRSGSYGPRKHAKRLSFGSSKPCSATLGAYAHQNWPMPAVNSLPSRHSPVSRKKGLSCKSTAPLADPLGQAILGPSYTRSQPVEPADCEREKERKKQLPIHTSAKSLCSSHPRKMSADKTAVSGNAEPSKAKDIVPIGVLDSPSSEYSVGAYSPQTPQTWAQIAGKDTSRCSSHDFFDLTPPSMGSDSELIDISV